MRVIFLPETFHMSITLGHGSYKKVSIFCYSFSFLIVFSNLCAFGLCFKYPQPICNDRCCYGVCIKGPEF